MKALWALETSLVICGARQVAIILDISLAIAWMRQMGLKSVTSSAPSFLGRRAMFVEFSHYRLLTSKDNAPTSFEESPGETIRTGALSLAVLLTAVSTSSSEKGMSCPPRSHSGTGMFCQLKVVVRGGPLLMIALKGPCMISPFWS